MSPASWFIQGFYGSPANGAIVPAFLDRFLGLWSVLFQAVRQTEVSTHDSEELRRQMHTMEDLAMSPVFLVWILITLKWASKWCYGFSFAAYLWNQLLYILFIFLKNILRVILITHRSSQHILFPVQTDSVFSTLKHYISKKPKHFFVLSCHEGRLDLGDTEMGFEEREGKSMKGLSLFCKFA